jgi:glycosyltransferase involved in cell wall biosynthesis
VLVEHDVTIDLYAQLLRQRADWETRQQYDRWLAFERGIWGEVDVVVTMSEKDKAMVAGARRVEAILNGVDLERFQPQGREPEAGRILFIGSFAHLPNLLALQFFLHECWNGLKAKGARLHVIAGARHEHYLELYRDRVEVDLRDSTIEVEGYVSDVREAYARAAVVIAPLLASAGTNIKIMEAMALGKAVVSTPAGINGLDLRDGDEVVVADTGAEMAAAILRLFSDEEYRRRLGKAARRRAEETYGWDAIARKQSELYRRLMEERKPAGAAGDS